MHATVIHFVPQKHKTLNLKFATYPNHILIQYTMYRMTQELESEDDGTSSMRTYESSAMSEYMQTAPAGDGLPKPPSSCSSQWTNMSSRPDCGGLIR